jgi:hypothetical protein
MQERFNKQFVDEDTGLLNIGKYDYEEVLEFIENELKNRNNQLLKEVDTLIKNVDEEFVLWTSGYLVACEDFEKENQ